MRDNPALDPRLPPPPPQQVYPRAAIDEGDRVAYSARFLRAIGIHSGWMPTACGTVLALEIHPGLTLAVIAWDGSASLARVNVKNLNRLESTS